MCQVGEVAENLAFPIIVIAIVAGIVLSSYFDTNKEKVELQLKIKQLEVQLAVYNQEKK